MRTHVADVTDLDMREEGGGRKERKVVGYRDAITSKKILFNLIDNQTPLGNLNAILIIFLRDISSS